MRAAAAGNSTLGIPASVGREFSEADPGGHLPPAKDMSGTDWRGLLRGLFKFLSEEAQEPEHVEGAGGGEDDLAPNAGIPAAASTVKPKRAASILFTTNDGKALFVKRSDTEENYPGYWSLPGGRAEDGEEPDACARRESAEEIGRDCSADEMAEVERKETPHGWEHTTYRVNTDAFEPKLNAEHSEHAWAPLGTPPAPLHPGVKATIDAMLKAAKDAADPSGKLSETTREQIGSTEHREDMPESAFLGPDRTYPVQEKRDGQWVYTRDLLLAASRRARMQGRGDIAKRADEIRGREFGEDAWNEGQHPRGRPENAGQFTSGAGGGGSPEHARTRFPGVHTQTPETKHGAVASAALRGGHALTHEDYEAFRGKLEGAKGERHTVAQKLLVIAKSLPSALKTHLVEEKQKAVHAVGALKSLAHGKKPTPEEMKGLRKFGTTVLLSAASMALMGEPTGAIPHLLASLGGEIAQHTALEHVAKLGAGAARFAMGGDAAEDLTPEDYALLSGYIEALAKAVEEYKAGDYAGTAPAADMALAMDWRGAAELVIDSSPAGIAFDRASARDKDRDGRLHVDAANISKATVNPYWGEEIPNFEELGLDPQKKYMLLRDPAELARPHTVRSFNNLPILIKHKPASADDHPADITIGSTGTDAEFSHPYLKNSLVFWPQNAIDRIESDKQKQLSCGYHYRADMTPGEYEGQHYDGVMRDIEGNHLALVEEGRAGADVVVGDAAFCEKPKESNMKLTARALVAKGMIGQYLLPRIATDSALPDLNPVVAGITPKAFDKKQLATAIRSATAGLLAKDADLSDVVDLLDAVEKISEPEVDQAQQLLQTADPAVAEPNAGNPGCMGPTEDWRAMDARRRLGRDETEEERKKREDDLAAAKDRRAMDARRRLGRDETEEEKAASRRCICVCAKRAINRCKRCDRILPAAASDDQPGSLICLQIPVAPE